MDYYYSQYVLRNIHCIGLSVVDIRIGNLPIVTHIQGGVIWGGVDGGSHMIITPKKLPSGGQPPETLLAENTDWGPGWNIVDEITESREKTENFSSADDEDFATAHDKEPE